MKDFGEHKLVLEVTELSELVEVVLLTERVTGIHHQDDEDDGIDDEQKLVVLIVEIDITVPEVVVHILGQQIIVLIIRLLDA
jgi:hypothetical protein